MNYQTIAFIIGLSIAWVVCAAHVINFISPDNLKETSYEEINY